MDKIYTALDYAIQRDGVKTVKERIKKLQAQHMKRGFSVPVHFNSNGSAPVKARIWQGHWVADCECKGAEFVDYNEPVFFCWSCGNATHAGNVRDVIFPKDREKIEEKILERPVKAMRGLDDLQRAEAAQAVISVNGQRLSRTWIPGETLADLEKQQGKAIKAWKKGKVK